MPIPSKNENRSDFVQRCIPIVMKDGTAEDSTQAVAICQSIWTDSKKKNSQKGNAE